MDLSNEKIDCNELLSFKHSSSKYIYDKELKGSHKFSQCRTEIDNQHIDRCEHYFDSFFEQNAWYGGKEGERLESHNNNVCKDIIIKNISNIKNEYSIKGNALIINDKVFNKNGLILNPIKKRKDLDVEYYIITVIQGKENAKLRYLDKLEAKEKQQIITDFIAFN